ncbi:hypothetical protein FZEAL_1991 [Fusarium zealandicum]|uniref:Uncharacterized protein n=1 Tax=Fusarium zealandicum TaxID=1053134 RepID=A0A8H4US56_9HYPO|nr:hypothetical protein FZEAL_1991 [Fusarium zealandicum]
MKFILLLGAQWSAQATAQRYTYTTQTMTECFSTTQANFGPAAPTQGADKYWTVEMPECQDCHCPDCAYTHTYTTTLDVFYPSGIAKYPYSIKEVYRGMSTMPVDATPTVMPYGFTSAVETCNNCGDEPLEATMTYPRGGSPFQENVPTATAAANTNFERPSTLQTKVASQETTAVPSSDEENAPLQTATLENTFVEHKVTKFHRPGLELADSSLESDTGLKVDQDEPKTSGSPSDELKNYSYMGSESAAAPSKVVDGGAGSLRPAAGVGVVLLLPLALLL